MECKHKYKIHETYYTGGAGYSNLNIQKRATVVCEKCARVQDVRVELE